MKNFTLFSTLLMAIISINAMAQSNRTSAKNPLTEISRVSDMAKPNSSEWQEGLVYKVQFLTSKVHLSKDDVRFKKLGNVYHYQQNGLYKYTWGRTRLPQEAQRLKRELYRNGFNDAFVVYFYNGKRITQKEAMALNKG